MLEPLAELIGNPLPDGLEAKVEYWVYSFIPLVTTLSYLVGLAIPNSWVVTWLPSGQLH